MKFGVLLMPTEYSIAPQELARLAEERGFESVWFPEHTHIPASRETPYPGGGELPQDYYHIMDPYIALTAAAMVTSRIRLGTGVSLVTERDPIVLAKEIATLDILSGGRFIFGAGAGWNREEMLNHGTRPSQRWRVMRERILAMKAIWTEDEPEFHGQFVNFDRIWSWPKPVQKPHPPVYIGGNSSYAMREVAACGDAWMPTHNPEMPPLGERLAELNRLLEEAGRGPVPITVFWVPGQPEVIEYYASLGVERCVFRVPSLPADQVVPILDRRAALIERFARA